MHSRLLLLLLRPMLRVLLLLLLLVRYVRSCCVAPAVHAARN
jgi:hypothetical protein